MLSAPMFWLMLCKVHIKYMKANLRVLFAKKRGLCWCWELFFIASSYPFMSFKCFHPGPDSAHMFPDGAKDVRWFAFWDHAVQWDRSWHSQAMVHAYSFWLEGRCPWTISKPDDDTAPSDIFSSRVAAWNVMFSDVCLLFTPGFENALFWLRCVLGKFPEESDEFHLYAIHLAPLAFKVLSDDQNQDKLRSVICIFAPARSFLGQYDTWNMEKFKGWVGKKELLLATNSFTHIFLKILQQLMWRCISPHKYSMFKDVYCAATWLKHCRHWRLNVWICYMYLCSFVYWGNHVAIHVLIYTCMYLSFYLSIV